MCCKKLCDVLNVEESSLPLVEGDTLDANLQAQSSSVEGCGFVLMTDNVDKNVRQSYQRIDRQTQSLHYCHSCAVKNRVNVSGLSDKPAAAEISVETFLPTDGDLKQLLNDMEILIQRLIMCTIYLNLIKSWFTTEF